MLLRLLYNTQTWVLQQNALRKINDVYMRVLRRILGKPRYKGGQCSDVSVRNQLQQPSIDCLLIRRRLKYVGRVLQNRHKSLYAVLSLKYKGMQLPWVQLVASDLQKLYDNVSGVRQCLPAPCGHPMKWFCFITSFPEKWTSFISQLYFEESSLDKEAPASVSHVVSQFVCLECDDRPAFYTEKALSQHKRVRHGFRHPIVQYIDGSGACLACRNDYKTRLRVLSHVCETRRSKCRDIILNGDFPKIPPGELSRLCADDRSARKAARREGHSHAIAEGSARTACGKRIGHVCK